MSGIPESRIERRNVTDLTPADYNPRTITDRALGGLRASVERFGLVQPIIVNDRTGNVVGGHQRLKVLLDLGTAEVDVVVVDLPKTEEKALNVALNSPAISGDFNEGLEGVLQDIAAEDSEMFNALLMDDVLPEEAETMPPPDKKPDNPDDDKLPELPPPITQAAEVVEMGRHVLHCGDCIKVMLSLEPESIDAIVTDPPYGLGFMGKAWDALPPGRDWADAAFRVLKPGGHLIAFGGTRTIHRLACAVEDAGFEIRDMISWLQWQGFPKGSDVSRLIDELHGAKRATIRSYSPDGESFDPKGKLTGRMTSTQVCESCHKTRSGGGGDSSCKCPPAPPITDDAKRWNGWGTTLKPTQEPMVLARKPMVENVASNVLQHGVGGINVDGCRYKDGDIAWPGPPHELHTHTDGRWPANIYHCPKPHSGEKEGNDHPTVKPVRLMRWLVRLVTPPGGVVLEPFAGSGTTVIAAEREGFRCIAIEREPAYCDIIRARVGHAING